MNKKNYTLRESALTYIFVLLALFCASLLVMNLVSTVAQSTGQDINVVVNENWVKYINIASAPIALFFVYLVFNFTTKTDFKTATRLKVKFDIKICLGTIILAVITILACVNATSLFNYIFGLREATSSVGIPLDSFWQFLLAVLLLAVLPAIVEELIFRGIIFNGLRQKFSAIVSIVLSGAMFSLFHLSIYNTFFQFILGVVLAWLVHYTGSIVYSMIYHFANNFTIVLISYLSKGASIFEFGAWGVKEVLLTILFFIVGMLVVYLFFRILKSYANKHKKYFGYEINNKPLEALPVEQSEQQEIDNEVLSDYDKRLINNNNDSKDKFWLFISILAAVVIWSFSSFGGFI